MLFEERLYSIIGQKIRAARQNVSMTQEDLAQKAGLVRTSISNIENGQQKIQIHTLYAIANALFKPITAFLPETATKDRGIEDLLKRSSVMSEHGEVELEEADRQHLRNLLNMEE